MDCQLTRQEIAARVLTGLKERLLEPELVASFVASFQKQLSQDREQRRKAKNRVDKQIAEIEHKVSGIMSAVEDGLYEPSVKSRLASLKEDKARLMAQAADIPDRDISVLTHPKLAKVYRRKVADLETLLEGSDHRPALELIRSMIDGVILVPNTDRTALDATLVGDLASILNICAELSGKSKLPGIAASGSQLSVVAGGRYHLYRTMVFLGGRLSQKHTKVTDFI